MLVSEFDYFLPAELIASQPHEKRDQARLLVLERNGVRLSDERFYRLDHYLRAGDVLVLNDSKVIKARLEADSMGKKYQLFLIKEKGLNLWECWLKAASKVKSGQRFEISNHLSAQIIRVKNNYFDVEFSLSGAELLREVERVGQMPLPPYIIKRRKETNQPEYQINDQDNYQTIYAEKSGSVAAPTAGLHFTSDLLARLNKKGVQLEKVTLHVGAGTFEPIRTEKIEDFKIHHESYWVAKETAIRLNKAKKEKRRIVAVGTTTVRVLESIYDAEKRQFVADNGETNIYIYPGHKFKTIDGLVTNFHLPKSSLLLLVSALAGFEETKKAYNYAIEKGYRFYSYGDAMLII